jgi:hypothetical protein
MGRSYKSGVNAESANCASAREAWVAHASRVLVALFQRDGLSRNSLRQLTPIPTKVRRGRMPRPALGTSALPGADFVTRVSVRFHWGTFAIFRTSLRCAAGAEDGDSQVPDLLVQLRKRGLAEVMRRGEVRFAPGDVAERPLEIACGKFRNVSNGFFDRRNAMTDHGQIVSSPDRAADRFFKPVLIQDRAHIEVVGHDQTLEAKLAAEKLGHDAMRQ